MVGDSIGDYGAPGKRHRWLNHRCRLPGAMIQPMQCSDHLGQEESVVYSFDGSSEREPIQWDSAR
jgi:hypothetical protein